ncbi:MAG: hypothetical protein GX070_03770 [Alcaligenaceae bacterium]|nr:hypothetical protein [Alcaligenaceae bacterium]
MKRITTLLMLAAVMAPVAWSQTSETINDPACQPALTGHPCKDKSQEPSLNLGAGNPIHLISGNKHQEETDLPFLPSGLELVRYYNSLSKGNPLLGEGWSHSYDTRLHFAGSKLQIVHADGSRTMFQPRQGDIARAVQSSQGKLQLKDNLWHWDLGNGLGKVFNQHGRLIQVNWPGLEPIRITREEKPGPTRHAIMEVQAGQQHKLVFHYEIFKDTARLSRINSHAGTFLYRHEQPDQHKGLRLTGMQRPDKMGKTYAYEAQYQHGNPFLLTGISMHDHTGKKTVRTSSWAYNEKGLAIRSITGGQNDTRNRIEIEYIVKPGAENAKGLTRVLNAEGKPTDFHTAIKGGKYVLEEVTGAGCYGCAAPGTKASYDSNGRMTSLNGTRIEYGENGHISQLDISRSPWPGLQLHYDAKDRPVTWSSKITGAEHTRYNDRNQPVEQDFANGDRALFEYDEDGLLVKVTEGIKKPHPQFPEIITQIQGSPEKGSFTIQNNTERIRFNITKNGSFIINTQRHNFLSPNVDFDDRYTHEDSGKTRIHHLPEGGYISYFYNQENKPETIIWTEQSGKKHHLILDSSIPEKGYILGNQLAFHALKTAEGQTQLSLWNKDKRFWTQTLDFSEDNTLRSEATIVPDANYETGRSYAYDPSQRMVSTKTSAQYKEQDLSGLHHYAWNKDGSSAAHFNGSDTIKPAIERDASGLPLKVGDIELGYGTNRKLGSVSKNNKSLAHYFYNAVGHRVIKITPDSHTHYYYEKNLLVGEWTLPQNTGKHKTFGADGNISRRYIYAGRLPVAFIEYERAVFDTNRHLSLSEKTSNSLLTKSHNKPYLSKLYFIHADHIGQPFMVTDQQQNIRWLAHNSPTGKSHILHADIEFNLRLPGQYYDQETGWHYNMHRYYDPDAGHYLEPDPIGPIPSNDPFGYADQQPRRFTDPLGLLLFAFDGTTNDLSSNTNVHKFADLYIDPYHHTDGTGKIFKTTIPAGILDSAMGYTTSLIIKKQVETMINAIGDSFNPKENNNPRIPIDVIAYSRGSAIALQFANLLADHTDEHGHFSMEYSSDSYDINTKTLNACLDLRFIGLFDMVPQFGILGSENKFHTYTVPDEWQWVAHAVALNEHRTLFPLTPLTGTGNNWVEQGFIGAHSNIGGTEREEDLKDPNNPNPGQYSDLGDIPLAWMVWQAEQAGVPMQAISGKLANLENPALYGTPARNAPLPYKDRYIQTPGNSETDTYQDKHALLGRTARYKVDTFIKRFRTHNPPDYILSQPIIGVVDTKKYVAWLEDELNWESPFYKK